MKYTKFVLKILSLLAFVIILVTPMVFSGVSYPLPTNLELRNGESGSFKFQIQNFGRPDNIVCSASLEGISELKIKFDKEQMKVAADSAEYFYGTVSVPNSLTNPSTEYTQTFCVTCKPDSANQDNQVSRTCNLPINVIISQIAPIGIKWFTEKEDMVQGEEHCINYGIFNPSTSYLATKVYLDKELSKLIVHKPTDSIIIEPNTYSENAKIFELCLYTTECSGDSDLYVGDVVIIEDKEGAIPSVSAPLTILVKCKNSDEETKEIKPKTNENVQTESNDKKSMQLINFVVISFLLLIIVIISVMLYKRGKQSTSMENCAKCGYKLKKGDDFCPECGKKIKS